MKSTNRKFFVLAVAAFAFTAAACSDNSATGPALSPLGPSVIVTFDPETGEGFVGKGDVQLVFGWNNKALQDNAALVQFGVNSVTETTWFCSKPHPSQEGEEIVQGRSNTTTIEGLFVTIARENSKGKDGPVTGFFLNGFDGTSSETTVGDPLESCPANPSGFALVAGSTQVEQIGGEGLTVSINGTNWFPL